MSLLLDALKKSEAQRRRGKAPAVDLATTPPAARSARPAWRWPLLVLPIVLLVAAAIWMGPEVYSRIAGGQDGGDSVASRGAALSGAEASGRTAQSQTRKANVAAPARQMPPPEEPAPVAGAGRARAVVARAETQAAAATPDPVATGSPGAQQPEAEARSEGEVSSGLPSGSEREAQAQPKPKPLPEPKPERASKPDPEPESRPEPEPRANFIRPWELPQAQRAEFPDLNLTVHFYSEQPSDRFVLINGERRSEGQSVAKGVRLVEIRRRGAVVDFAGYRVLIE